MVERSYAHTTCFFAIFLSSNLNRRVEKWCMQVPCSSARLHARKSYQCCMQRAYPPAKSAVFLMFFSCDGYSGQQLPQKGTMLPLAQAF
jgi:hypothetical protein